MPDFDTLSPTTRRAIQFARAAAEQMNHDSIGTENLLLGIVQEREDLAVYFLNLLGVRLKSLVKMLTELAEEDRPHTRPLELTERARTALEIAEEQRRRLGHAQIGTVHVLMGLLDLPEGNAVKTLKRMHVDVDEVSASLRLFYEPYNGRPPLGPVLEKVRDARLEWGDQEQAPVHVEVSEEDLGARARLIFALARANAGRMEHPYVGTDHLLLGLLAENDGAAARVLTAMGLTEKRLSLAVLFARGLQSAEQSHQAGPRTISPRAQNALTLARFAARCTRSLTSEREPQRLPGRLYPRLLLESSDLLLGLLDEGHGLAITILDSFGLDQDEIRARLKAHARWRTMVVRPMAQEPATFWEWTNQQLIRRQWSLADLARESGIRRSSLRSWVQSKGRPSPKSCDALAAAVAADPNLVRRLAGHSRATSRPTMHGRAAIHALIDQVAWNDERAARIASLLQTMLDGDGEQTDSGPR
jgi:ATP-dependent Clp protease ATP-binding subunit ClpA